MTTRKTKLTDEQQKRNAQILAQLEAERRQLWEETRALQRQYRRQIRDQRTQSSGEGIMGETTD